MHVIAFASQKGGSGKTTLAGHIAVEAELRGAGPVALIDTDPQGSLSQITFPVVECARGRKAILRPRLQ